MALEVLTAHMPDLVGGSADLTGSNNTKTKSTRPFGADNYAGATSITASANSAWPRR
jgi:transketolase